MNVPFTMKSREKIWISYNIRNSHGTIFFEHMNSWWYTWKPYGFWKIFINFRQYPWIFDNNYEYHTKFEIPMNTWQSLRFIWISENFPWYFPFSMNFPFAMIFLFAGIFPINRNFPFSRKFPFAMNFLFC